ncbi:TolC family protein [Opitutus sp. ER46]|uniref:TolC family protein n=1 Tax=Opitutus sp. ER46 TaxID=2161864 RepID=UPI000D30C43E|nr:TolC family protein [Opitutus sp. ER46]PTX91362.1 transporter [Opitutus sp. ER46]
MNLRRFPVFLLLSSSLFAAEPLRPDLLVGEVAARHPELAFYQAELAAARASRVVAGARPDPEVALEVGRKRVHDVAGALAGEGTAWSVSVAQTFEWPGRLALRKAIANQDVALAELGVARFSAALRARVLTLAYGVEAEQEKAAALAEVAERFRALKEVFLARDPAGVTPLLETRVIEAQELAIQRRATAAALALQAAVTELNQLRGAALGTALTVAPVGLSFSPAPAAAELLRAARENHFDYQARRLELEQQGFAVQLARRERLPNVTLSPYVAQEEAGERERTIGLGVSVPLPLGARSRGGVELAQARRRQAEAALQVAERELEREVLAAAHAFAARQAEVARWTPDAVTRFREAAALADRHYRLGAVPLATYVELQSAYLEAVEALLDTRQEALTAALELQRLTGWPTPFVAPRAPEESK